MFVKIKQNLENRSLWKKRWIWSIGIVMVAMSLMMSWLVLRKNRIQYIVSLTHWNNLTSVTSSSSNTPTCEDYQVAFYPDDDQTQPIQCGQCIPGTSGLDTREYCAIHEYCTDDGQCQPITSHPLYHASCPRELGRPETKDGWCGAGLRCLQHQCRPCVTGMMDYADGKICVNDVWTYDTLQIGFYHPTVIFLTAFVVMVASNMCLDGCMEAVFACQKKRQRRIEENLKIFYQYMISTREDKHQQQ